MFVLGMMLLLISFLIFSAFFRLPLFIWSVLLLAIILLVGSYHPYFLFSLILFLPILVILNLPWLRQRLITEKIAENVRLKLPVISKTEQEVLEAGDVWWERELFCGNPNWSKFLKFADPQLSTDEIAYLNNQVKKLCALLNDWQIVQNRDLPIEVWDYIKTEKFWGLMIPKEYGGLGFSAYAHSTIVSQIASCSYSAAMTVMVPNSVGLSEFILHYGTEEQKKYYLPLFATGQEIPCFALTAPLAGSDAGAMLDKGVICYGEYQSETVLGIRLNWDKRYITLAPNTTLIGLVFKLYDPDHLLGDANAVGISVAMIPSQHPGVEIGTHHWPLYMGFPNGPTRGRDVFIPIEWLIGGKERRGHGWFMMMERLSVGRGISLPALSAAIAKLCYVTTSAYVKLREQFHIPIGNFEGIQEALARIGGFAYLCEATRRLTASAIDQGIKPSVATAITKYHLTELSRKIINDAMDIHGGKTIQVGPRNYLAHYYIATPISITVEGANILTRNLIIFGQGALRCHPYIRKEIIALKDPDLVQGMKAFDKLLVHHVGYTLRNMVRSFLYGLTGGRWIVIRGLKLKSRNDELSYLYQQLTRMSSALATVTDFTLLVIGGELKRKERLSARLGDVLSYLYLASAVLKYYEAEEKQEEDLTFTIWILKYLLAQIQNAFQLFFSNFPRPGVAFILDKIIFPWGKHYAMPSDEDDHIVAETMMQTSEFRNRMIKHCIIENEENWPWILEKIFAMKCKIDPVYKKLSLAMLENVISAHDSFSEQLKVAKQKNIISEEEYSLLIEFEKHRLDVIQVDEFDSLTREEEHEQQKTV